MLSSDWATIFDLTSFSRFLGIFSIVESSRVETLVLIAAA